jgi:hypothetical protein
MKNTVFWDVMECGLVDTDLEKYAVFVIEKSHE